MEDKKLNEFMVGMIDTHIHFNSHYGGKKNINALQAAKQAEDACNHFKNCGGYHIYWSRTLHNCNRLWGRSWIKSTSR